MFLLYICFCSFATGGLMNWDSRPPTQGFKVGPGTKILHANTSAAKKFKKKSGLAWDLSSPLEWAELLGHRNECQVLTTELPGNSL